jgi:hypothetical protein
MDDCIACHEERRRGVEKTAERGVVKTARALSTDCSACHR